MNDNKLLNEAYDGINEGLFNLRQDRTHSPEPDARDGFIQYCQDLNITPDHPSYRQIRGAYMTGFGDAKNIYHEVEDDWDRVKGVVNDPGFMGGETQDND